MGEGPVRFCLLLLTIQFCQPLTPDNPFEDGAKKFEPPNFCTLNCGDGVNVKQTQHLLCKFKRQKEVGGCSNIRGEMTPEERGHMVALHNKYRNEITLDPDAYLSLAKSNRSSAPYNLTGVFPSSSTLSQGFGYAECMRQLSWEYGNEKSAQIYAEQCTTEQHECITDYKESFPQMMSIFTKEGIHDGKDAMRMAFEHWRSNNLTLKGDRNVNETTRYSDPRVYIENRLDDYDYTDDEQSKFVEWASLAFWRTFLLGCGKAHFSENGKEWTRIVCIYGPGVNYIPELKLRDARTEEHSLSALYTMESQHYTRCIWGGEDHVIQYDLPPSCPMYKCYCRSLQGDIRGPDDHADKNSSWPWLCYSDCNIDMRWEKPIPPFMEYLRGASVRRTGPALAALSLAAAAITYL